MRRKSFMSARRMEQRNGKVGCAFFAVFSCRPAPCDQKSTHYLPMIRLSLVLIRFQKCLSTEMPNVASRNELKRLPHECHLPKIIKCVAGESRNKIVEKRGFWRKINQPMFFVLVCSIRCCSILCLLIK